MTHMTDDDRATPRRLGASTLGAPDEPLPTVLDGLRRAGVAAVELRVGPEQPVDAASPEPVRRRVRELIAGHGLEVLAVASYVRLGQGEDTTAVVDDLERHLHLAADLGARFVRVFPGAPDAAGGDDVVMIDRLARVADRAQAIGVRIALETHDSHPRGEDVARLLDQVGHRWIGAIWDFAHPFRHGEPPEQTWAHLGRHLIAGAGYVQVKDLDIRTRRPALIGSGDLPLARTLQVLDAGGYRDVLSLEWERAWYPDLPPLEDALASLLHWLEPAARPH
ncbi:MAG: sugar phosphate isomerase/epimerase family protein [Dermatophilaceae bacterium]